MNKEQYEDARQSYKKVYILHTQILDNIAIIGSIVDDFWKNYDYINSCWYYRTLLQHVKAATFF